MKEVDARRLAVRMSQVMERYDHWSYADLLADFDNNEELLLEYQAKMILENPDMVFDGMLDTMEKMIEEMEA